MGVEDAKEEDTLRLSLITHALRRGVWLAGFALMIASFVMQALALHAGDLSEVQPLLVTELLFLVFILATWFGYPIGRREWFGVTVAAGGLAGFLAFSAPTGGNKLPRNLDWLLVGGSVVAAMIVTTVLALRGPRWWRAAMFGTAAAIAYAFTAALTKEVTHYVAADGAGVFLHWETYGLALFGATAVFLTQNAFHAGPLAASQSTLVLVDPLASICIGIALFGDSLRTSGPYGPLEALSLLVMFMGAVFLSNSPLITGMKSEGKGVEYDEMLSRRLKHPHHAAQDPVSDSGLPPFSSA
jgi:hypothetical protein